MRYFIGVAIVWKSSDDRSSYKLSVNYALAETKDAARHMLIDDLCTTHKNHGKSYDAGLVDFAVTELPAVFVEAIKNGTVSPGDGHVEDVLDDDVLNID